MSYIEKAKQNKANAEKAAAFDAQQQSAREQQVYDKGLGDAYTAVEREMMRKAQEREMDRQMQQAAARYENRGANDYNPSFNEMLNDVGAWMGRKADAAGNYISNKANGLADSFVDAVVGTPQQQNRYAAEGEALRRDVEAEAARQAMLKAQGTK